MNATTESPISFPVSVSRLPGKGMSVTIEADADQRAALANVHSLRSVVRFRADLDVTSWKKGGAKVIGRVRADIVQNCIVTLDPVDGTVDEAISALFLPVGSKLALPKQSPEGEIILDADGDDGPELFSGDMIDVGQLAEEFFALGIDPYPRKAGVSIEKSEAEAGEQRGPLYDKLQALKKKR